MMGFVGLGRLEGTSNLPPWRTGCGGGVRERCLGDQGQRFGAQAQCSAGIEERSGRVGIEREVVEYFWARLNILMVGGRLARRANMWPQSPCAPRGHAGVCLLASQPMRDLSMEWPAILPARGSA